jgi:hypothetical protein
MGRSQKSSTQEDTMKPFITKAMMLVVVFGGLMLGGCSESPKAYPFGPIPHDKEADSGDQAE